MCEFEEEIKYAPTAKGLAVYEALIQAYMNKNPDATREEASMQMFSIFGSMSELDEEERSRASGEDQG